MSSTERNIPRVIRTLLAHQGKNQNELAAHMGVGHSAISKALNTRDRDWTVRELDKLSDFFNVPVMVFYQNPDNLIRGSAAQSDGGSENYLFTDRDLVAA